MRVPTGDNRFAQSGKGATTLREGLPGRARSRPAPPTSLLADALSQRLDPQLPTSRVVRTFSTSVRFSTSAGVAGRPRPAVGIRAFLSRFLNQPVGTADLV